MRHDAALRLDLPGFENLAGLGTTGLAVLEGLAVLNPGDFDK